LSDRATMGDIEIRLRRRFADRGASSLELAILTPILILVILLVIQFAMVYHARHVALAAAQHGARIARDTPQGAWESQAETEAQSYAGKIGPDVLGGVHAQAYEDQNQQRWVTVTGTAVKIVPGITIRVRQRSGGPIECYRPDIGAATNCQVPNP
jgi:Flp pilus assembly protein TadG